MDNETLLEALTLIFTRIETMKANAEDASNIAYATRAALSAALKEQDPELEKRFQHWIDYYQPFVSRHVADDQIQAMLRRLSSLPPK
jgi:hypothetical protein